MSGLDAALTQLTRLPDVSMVCVPGLVDADAQKKVITHCEDMGDRVRDPRRRARTGAAQAGRAAAEAASAACCPKAGFARALLAVDQDPRPDRTDGTTALATVPPSGHIAGVMARSDASVGVHKAPANEPVRGARGPGLHPQRHRAGRCSTSLNINALRLFPGRPAAGVGGAHADRRHALALRQRATAGVLHRGLDGRRASRWAVFEPNNMRAVEGAGALDHRVPHPGLGGRRAVRRDGQGSLLRQDRRGAQPAGGAGARAGVSSRSEWPPIRPAEYVILALGLWDGGAQVTRER